MGVAVLLDYAQHVLRQHLRSVRLRRPGHRAPRKTLQPPHVFVVAVRKTVRRVHQLAFVQLVKPPVVRTAVHPHRMHTLVFLFFSHPLHTSLSPPVLYEVIHLSVVDAVVNPPAGAAVAPVGA